MWLTFYTNTRAINKSVSGPLSLSVHNLFIPVSVCRRRTSSRVQLPEPRPDVADAYALTPNYRHTLTYSPSFFHMHTIMNTYCACIQGASGWTVGVIDDSLAKHITPLLPHTLLPAVSRKPLAALST